MRLFLALQCSADVREKLAALQPQLLDMGRLKAVESENMHVTLKFLGGVDEGRLGAVTSALEKVSASSFTAAVEGLGAFPKPDYPRVVWAGLSDGFDEAVELHLKVDERLAGFKPDKRYHPHVTLARVRGPVDKPGLKAFLQAHEKTVFGSYSVSSFDLMESRLSPKGPTYSVVEKFPLE